MSTRDQDHKPSILPLSGADDGKRAVKTTIVGGQPPGNQRAMQPVPVGLEQLMAMAAVSDEFSEELWRDRDAAVEASGVELTGTERAILGSVDDAALQKMVAGVGRGIPEQDRRGFLNMSAAAVLALVGGGSLAAGAAGCDRTTKGIRPDHPAPTGARPDRPDDDEPTETKTGAETETEPEPEPETKRPDAGRPPMPPTGARPDRPERPDRPRPTRGARPSRPPPRDPDYQGKTGSRPDRPEHFQGETGARPDRPPKKKPDKPKKPPKLKKKPPKLPPPRTYPNRGMSIRRPVPIKKEED